MIEKDIKLTLTTFHEWEAVEPGRAALFDDGHILTFTCAGCRNFINIPLCYDNKMPHEWLLTEGNIIDPTTWTLSPSINCIGCCGWHGYLTKGVFTSC